MRFATLFAVAAFFLPSVCWGDFVAVNFPVESGKTLAFTVTKSANGTISISPLPIITVSTPTDPDQPDDPDDPTDPTPTPDTLRHDVQVLAEQYNLTSEVQDRIRLGYLSVVEAMPQLRTKADVMAMQRAVNNLLCAGVSGSSGDCSALNERILEAFRAREGEYPQIEQMDDAWRQIASGLELESGQAGLDKSIWDTLWAIVLEFIKQWIANNL